MTTSARLLALLSLLQTRRDWTGPQLAERLGVTTRTIRNDVERLRGLGYPLEATPGSLGGYRLGVGAALPPLLLDDDEAVAVAVGLRTAGTVDGIEETSVRALAKLEQMLPSRLRRRVNALQTHTVPIPGSGPVVDPGVLTTIAAACRDHERLRFDYRDHSGNETLRVVEPYRLVSSGRRWYLVAWDADKADWRTFRVDRVSPRTPTGPRFRPREAPEGGVAQYVTQGLATATWRFRGRVRLLAPLSALTGRLPAVATVESSGEDSCVVSVGSDSPQMLAHYIGLLDVDFEVLEPVELVEQVRVLAARFARAAD